MGMSIVRCGVSKIKTRLNGKKNELLARYGRCVWEGHSSTYAFVDRRALWRYYDSSSCDAYNCIMAVVKWSVCWPAMPSPRSSLEGRSSSLYSLIMILDAPNAYGDTIGYLSPTVVVRKRISCLKTIDCASKSPLIRFWFGVFCLSLYQLSTVYISFSIVYILSVYTNYR